jgi:hypothetical protein
MSAERKYAHVDSFLRLRPRPFPGIVLTTAAVPFPFAGTNVVIPIEEVLSSAGAKVAIDVTQLKVAYRQGQLAAMGGSAVSLKVSPDGYAAVLYIPGKAPWRVTGKAKIAVLQRLIEAHAAGTHVNTKKLMEDTGCASPSNLFSKREHWRNYLIKVDGARAWRLNIPSLDVVIDDDDDAMPVAELVESL